MNMIDVRAQCRDLILMRIILYQEAWEGYKEFWSKRFSFLTNYATFINRRRPLPSWSTFHVHLFITSDPLHGPVLRTAREAINSGLTISVIGAVSTAAGGVFRWTLGQEIANRLLQFYRLNTMAAQVKFMDWWEQKCEGQYQSNCLMQLLLPFLQLPM